MTARRAAPKKAIKTKPQVSTHPAKIRTKASNALIAKLRRTCMAQPEATEQLAWGEPTWRLGGKLFAQFDDHHHGGAHVSIWLPAADGAQAALIEAEPEHIWRPPYVGHLGWIAIKLDTDPPWAMVEALVAQAYELVRSKQKPTPSLPRSGGRAKARRQ